jgi:hypothetical protein
MELEAERISPARALEIFDRLDPVELDFLSGLWQGKEVYTGHPLNGLLTLCHWYGKEFIDAENVHPLLFTDRNNQIFKVAPYPVIVKISIKFLKSYPHLLPAIQPWLLTAISWLKTNKSQAKLRKIEHRGKITSAMFYNTLPIVDFFRKIDNQTILGLMDWRDLPEPFFFILKCSNN